VSGTLSSLSLHLAGLGLQLDGLQYRDATFTVATAKLGLPPGWGNGSITLSNVRITKDGLQLGSAGANFSTTQAFYLGGSAGSSASVKFDQLAGSFTYLATVHQWRIALQARLSFAFGNDAPTTAQAQLTIAQGHVNGTLSSLSLHLAGLGLQLDGLQYRDTTFTVATAKLGLPPGWGTGSITLNDVR